MTFFYTVQQVDGMSSEYTVPHCTNLNIDTVNDTVSVQFITVQNTRKTLTEVYSKIVTLRLTK